LAAGELLASLGVALAAGEVAAAPVVLADGLGDGLAGAAVPTAPPPRVVPWPGLPWTTADSGLPAAPSTTVTAMAPPMNAAAMMAARPAPRRLGRGRPCRPAAVLVVVAVSGSAAVSGPAASGRVAAAASPPCRWRVRMASARAAARAVDRRMPRSAHHE